MMAVMATVEAAARDKLVTAKRSQDDRVERDSLSEHNGDSEDFDDIEAIRRQFCRGGVNASKRVPFALDVITVNVTAWPAAVELLKTTEANTILLQEHKLADSDSINAAKNLADGLGWLSVWGAAKPGKGGKNSSGVAILTRRGIGLREYPVKTAHPERIVAATVEALGLPSVLVTSV
jgi:hypothetical protein